MGRGVEDINSRSEDGGYLEGVVTKGQYCRVCNLNFEIDESGHDKRWWKSKNSDKMMK